MSSSRPPTIPERFRWVADYLDELEELHKKVVVHYVDSGEEISLHEALNKSGNPTEVQEDIRADAEALDEIAKVIAEYTAWEVAVIAGEKPDDNAVENDYIYEIAFAAMRCFKESPDGEG